MVWRKVGTTLTCTNALTPSAVELKFHGASDLQRIRLRKFGYAGRNLDIKSTDDNVNAVLGEPASNFFSITADAKPEIKHLNAALEKEFQHTIFSDPEPFRCVPFELDFVHVVENAEPHDMTLVVAINLDRSFGGPAFRLASHSGTRDERPRKMAEAALDGGIAVLFARLRQIAAKFPSLKAIEVTSSYLTTEAFLDTRTIDTTHMQGIPTFENVSVYNYATGRYEYRPQFVMEWRMMGGRGEITVVNDRPVEKVIALTMQVAQIPDTLDKRAITDAVMANGKISLAESSDSSAKPQE
jgi:hypothetical protein